ncbi:hypothetical protein ACLKA6_013871 [Drosophila palustris]
MDSSRGDAAVSSELKSAINIALFQAQQTYMAAMDTQFAEYKAMFRHEMLTFMAQIRETAQQIPEPVLAVASPPPEAAQDEVSGIKVISELMAQAPNTAQHSDEEKKSADGSLRPGVSGDSDLQFCPLGIPEQKAHQWPCVQVRRDSYELIHGEPKALFRLHTRISKVVSQPNWRGRLLREGDTSQPGKDPGTDSVVEALYRPRAGGGIPRLNLERKDIL